MTKSKARDYAGKFKKQFELNISQSCLLIVDMQYATASREKGLGAMLKDTGRIEDGRWRFDRIEKTVIPNIQKLLDFFRKNNSSIVFLTFGSEKEDFSDLPQIALSLVKATNNKINSETHEILEEIKPLPGEKVLNKTTFNAFVSSNIDEVLKEMGARQLLFCGVSTNTCVESTARDAADRDYNCVIVEDACSGPAEKYHAASLENFARLFGRVSSTENVLNELIKNNH